MKEKGNEAGQKPKFERNGFYEKLIEMRKRGKLKITALSTPSRLALMQYEAAKREYEALKR